MQWQDEDSLVGLTVNWAYGNGPDVVLDCEVLSAGMYFGSVRERVDGFETDAEAADRGQALGTFRDTTNTANIRVVKPLTAMGNPKLVRGEGKSNLPRSLPTLA